MSHKRRLSKDRSLKALQFPVKPSEARLAALASLLPEGTDPEAAGRRAVQRLHRGGLTDADIPVVEFIAGDGYAVMHERDKVVADAWATTYIALIAEGSGRSYEVVRDSLLQSEAFRLGCETGLRNPIAPDDVADVIRELRPLLAEAEAQGGAS